MDEELQRLRRAGASDELVRALARARLDDELVTEHGARTRAGGEVGAIVERAWETALGRLRPSVAPGPPVFVGSLLIDVVGQVVVLTVSYRLQLVPLDDAPPPQPRPFLGLARIDAGLLILEAGGQRLTLLSPAGAVEVSNAVGARVREAAQGSGEWRPGGEWLQGASADGGALCLRDQDLGSCVTRIVRAVDGATTEVFERAHDVSVSWRHDRVLVRDRGLRRRRLSRPEEPLVLVSSNDRRFIELHDGRLLVIEGRPRLLDPEGCSEHSMAGPDDLVDATLAPDRLALLGLDLDGRMTRLPLDADEPPAGWLEGSGVGWAPFEGVPRPEVHWHPWASAALVTTAAGCDVIGLDGRLLASLGPDRHGLGWSPDGRTALVVHAPHGAQAGALEAWTACPPCPGDR